MELKVALALIFVVWLMLPCMLPRDGTLRLRKQVRLPRLLR